jgi:hypothetical protein
MVEHMQGLLDRRTGKVEELCPSCYGETARIQPLISDLEIKLIEQNQIKPQRKPMDVMKHMRGEE